MRLPGQTDRIRLDGYFSPGGFAEEDGLWPKGDTAFSGYQLLLEYFTFRDKFMFVHFNGLDGITPPAGAEYFDIEVVFSTPWPSDLPVTDAAVRLHCVPVINLFTLEADPLTITGLESEYLLRPKRLQDGHTEIYSVDSVTGSNRTNDAEYVPFSSFRHKGGMMRRQAPPRYYHTRVKRSVTGLYDTWLILGGHQWEDDRLLDREAVSLQITGTNGQLPRRALQSTLLDRCEQVVSTPLSVRNLCKPTLPVYPPAEDRFHWRVLSHLGLPRLKIGRGSAVDIHRQTRFSVKQKTLKLLGRHDHEVVVHGDTLKHLIHGFRAGTYPTIAAVTNDCCGQCLTRQC